MTTLVTWLQYYKLKPPQPLFSKCKSNCFIGLYCFIAFLSNKHNQSCSELPHQNGASLNKDFVGRKTYLKFLLPEQYLWHAQIKQMFLRISLDMLREINFISIKASSQSINFFVWILTFRQQKRHLKVVVVWGYLENGMGGGGGGGAVTFSGWSETQTQFTTWLLQTPVKISSEKYDCSMSPYCSILPHLAVFNYFMDVFILPIKDFTSNINPALILPVRLKFYQWNNSHSYSTGGTQFYWYYKINSTLILLVKPKEASTKNFCHA